MSTFDVPRPTPPPIPSELLKQLLRKATAVDGELQPDDIVDIYAQLERQNVESKFFDGSDIFVPDEAQDVLESPFYQAMQKTPFARALVQLLGEGYRRRAPPRREEEPQRRLMFGESHFSEDTLTKVIHALRQLPDPAQGRAVLARVYNLFGRHLEPRIEKQVRDAAGVAPSPLDDTPFLRAMVMLSKDDGLDFSDATALFERLPAMFSLPGDDGAELTRNERAGLDYIRETLLVPASQRDGENGPADEALDFFDLLYDALTMRPIDDDHAVAVFERFRRRHSELLETEHIAIETVLGALSLTLPETTVHELGRLAGIEKPFEESPVEALKQLMVSNKKVHLAGLYEGLEHILRTPGSGFEMSHLKKIHEEVSLRDDGGDFATAFTGPARAMCRMILEHWFGYGDEAASAIDVEDIKALGRAILAWKRERSFGTDEQNALTGLLGPDTDPTTGAPREALFEYAVTEDAKALLARIVDGQATEEELIGTRRPQGGALHSEN
jgi:hypothetical protein